MTLDKTTAAMKLEFKHLAPYLPYGLTGICTEEAQGIETVCGFSQRPDGTCQEIHTNIDALTIDAFKPMLRPLSNYSDINSESSTRLNLDLSMLIELNEIANKYRGYWNASYGTIQMMCENHIDFQGLIDANLAIAIED